MGTYDIRQLTEKFVKFRDERNWKQFHKPKDMALSLVLEATEVLELFQWKNDQASAEYVMTHKNMVADELVDALYWVLLMAHDLDVDLAAAVEEKMAKNREKYPTDTCKGRAEKYTEL